MVLFGFLQSHLVTRVSARLTIRQNFNTKIQGKAQIKWNKITTNKSSQEIVFLRSHFGGVGFLKCYDFFHVCLTIGQIEIYLWQCFVLFIFLGGTVMSMVLWS